MYESWTCAKSNLPVLAGYSSWGLNYPERCEVVLLRRDGFLVDGTYDGLGRIGDLDIAYEGIIDELNTGTAKMVLKTQYAGETFAEIEGQSHIDPWKGNLYEAEFLDRIFEQGGFASFEAFRQAKRAYDKARRQRHLAQMTRNGKMPNWGAALPLRPGETVEGALPSSINMQTISPEDTYIAGPLHYRRQIISTAEQIDSSGFWDLTDHSDWSQFDRIAAIAVFEENGHIVEIRLIDMLDSMYFNSQKHGSFGLAAKIL